MWHDETTAGDKRPFSVSEITRQIKQVLQTGFARVHVVGEVADLARPRSGHIYFTLKDDSAQLKAVMWRSTAQRFAAVLDDGTEVVAWGGIDVYPPRGSYQLIVQGVEVLGKGALERALRKLRQKLAAEGLFDAQWKKELPAIPATIAVITSPTSAALRDFLEVLRRRWRQTRVLVIPAQMQGETAARDVVQGLRTAHKIQPRPDVVVVTRGGGSIEDLWAFNDEGLVRAIHSADIPVVSAIGHEIDVTLCDLVADLRALTPSEAAERIVPDGPEFSQRIDANRQRLYHAAARRMEQARWRLQRVADRPVFQRPREMIYERQQRMDDLQQRLVRAISDRLAEGNRSLTRVEDRLKALSPLAVLQRGYSITMDAARRRVIKSSRDVGAGESMWTVLAEGEVQSTVSAKTEGKTSAQEKD